MQEIAEEAKKTQEKIEESNKMQELPIKKRSSYIDRIKRGFGLGD